MHSDHWLVRDGPNRPLHSLQQNGGYSCGLVPGIALCTADMDDSQLKMTNRRLDEPILLHTLQWTVSWQLISCCSIARSAMERDERLECWNDNARLKCWNDNASLEWWNQIRITLSIYLRYYSL
jgi:hypothetical protein